VAAVEHVHRGRCKSSDSYYCLALCEGAHQQCLVGSNLELLKILWCGVHTRLPVVALGCYRSGVGTIDKNMGKVGLFFPLLQSLLKPKEHLFTLPIREETSSRQDRCWHHHFLSSLSIATPVVPRVKTEGHQPGEGEGHDKAHSSAAPQSLTRMKTFAAQKHSWKGVGAVLQDSRSLWQRK